MAALVLVSTKNRELWEGPTPEVRDSRTSGHFPHARRQVNSEHARKTGPSLRSQYLVVTRRSAASGELNATRARSEEGRLFSQASRVFKFASVGTQLGHHLKLFGRIRIFSNCCKTPMKFKYVLIRHFVSLCECFYRSI